MESTLSGTEDQEGLHVDQPLTSSWAKLNVNLIRTSSQPIIYTTAQLHERIKKNPTPYYSVFVELKFLTKTEIQIKKFTKRSLKNVTKENWNNGKTLESVLLTLRKCNSLGKGKTTLFPIQKYKKSTALGESEN